MDEVVILFLAANPEGTNSLQLDEEIRAITEKLRASDKRDAIRLVSAWAVRPDDLLQKLNEHRPQIVHFSGHGSQTGEIVLVDNSGLPKSVTTAALGALFNTLKDNIQVVILNTCHSRTQAKAIKEVIDCVIGMNAAIGDQAAIIFAASFYRAVGFGRSVQEAFEQGKVALLLEEIPEDATPELLCKPDVDPSKIFLCGTGDRDLDNDSPKHSIIQTMTNSPSGIQVGGDINIDTERRMNKVAADLMINGLMDNPCQVTVGVLGMGGEPDRLANELLQIVKQAGCKATGVNHGVGFPSFYGVRVMYSPVDPPLPSVRAITDALKAAKIDCTEVQDSNQGSGAVYLYVGYKS